MGIPSKLQSGQKFKESTVKTVNQIIDYLKTQRVVGDNKTIRVNQGSSGLLLSATPQTPQKSSGGSASSFNHPFKLSIIQDEQGNNLLNMESGIVQFNGDVGKYAFCGYKVVELGSADEYKNPLSLPTEQGWYGVVLHLFYNSGTTQIVHNQTFDYRLCFYKGKQISSAINSSGIYSIPIGTINVTKPQQEQGSETEEGFIYSIIKQNVTSHIDIYDQLDVPFKAWFKMDSYPQQGAILDSLYPDKIVVNSGAVACNREIISYQRQEVDFQQGRFWLRINTVLNTAELTTESLQPNYTVDQMVYAFPLFDVYKDMESTANLIQGFQGNFSMSYDGRVQLDREDNTVNYLNNKLKYPTKKKEQLSEQEQLIYVQGKEYLIGIKENVSMNPDIKDNMDRLYWDWQKIKDYDKQEYLQLNVKMGDLKWQSAYLTLTDGDDTDPNYLSSKISVSNCLKSKVDNHVYKIMGYDVKKGKNLKVEKKNTDTDTPYHEISGYKTIVKQGDGITIDQDISTDGLDLSYEINFDSSILSSLIKSTDKSVIITTVPDATDPSKITLDLSAVKVCVDSTDTSPDYLVNKEFSENGSILFSVVGSRLNEKINPAYFTSKDNTVTFTQGTDYLDLSASGKLKVTDTDPTSGNLADKIISDNSSLTFTVTQVQELNIEINSAYFTSSDDSIEIDTSNPDFLDLKGGKVKVTENDTADYLSSKIEVDSSIASLITLDKQADKIVIKSAIQGSGIMLVNNGAVSLLQASGNAVLACQSGVIKWIPFADCENACNEQ